MSKDQQPAPSVHVRHESSVKHDAVSASVQDMKNLIQVFINRFNAGTPISVADWEGLADIATSIESGVAALKS